MNWKRREGDSTLPTRMTCDSMTQQMHPSICSLFAFATICTGEGGVPLLARARINFRRKEGVIQRWLSTGDAIYSGIETIKLIFPSFTPFFVPTIYADYYIVRVCFHEEMLLLGDSVTTFG